MPVTPEGIAAATEWVRAQRVAQGLPERIDESQVRQVAQHFVVPAPAVTTEQQTAAEQVAS